MAITNYTKNRTGDFDLGQLQNTVNVDKNIGPSCISVSGEEVSENSHDITFEFTNALNTPEEDRLAQLTNEHQPTSPAVPLTLLPFSDLDDQKLAVHPSYKPSINGTTYAMWTGAGDDLSQSPSGIGEGDLLSFVTTEQVGSPVVPEVISKEVHFDPAHGRVWIHEGYMSFEGGGHMDYLDSDVVASATPIQDQANKILYVDENNWIHYAVGSPNVATHGWAGTPVLIPRTFSADGDWDYDGVNLTPNLGGTGAFKISSTERVVHRYINKIPCCGSSPYFSMTSDETSEIPAGYFLRINVHNNSGTVWHAKVFMEIYRERTHIP